MNLRYILTLSAIALGLGMPTHGYAATTDKAVQIEGIGRVPQRIVLTCEQIVGDGGHETFYDADWDLFNDCVNDEIHRKGN